MKKLLYLLAFTMFILTAPKAGAQERSRNQAYPVTLPTMSLIGLTSSCDGSVDSRRNTLEKLWNVFGESQVFKGNNAVYRNKIYVVYFNHQPSGAYSIFIGYALSDWFSGKITVKNQSTMVLDIPKADYYAMDIRGTSTNSTIKAWDMMYQMFPQDKNKRAIEVYTLDTDNYTVQNITLYLKK